MTETRHLGFQVTTVEHRRLQMKTIPTCFIAALFLIPGLAGAGFKIDWSSFGGTAGQSTGGGWTVSGGVGDGAGTASGGPFTLTGGYWSVIGTVPAPGAPLLAIERSGASVRVSWPRSAEAFTLLETPSLTGSSGIRWTPGAYARETNVTHIWVTVPVSVGTRFFRLHKP